jgi:hypothetical protein
VEKVSGRLLIKTVMKTNRPALKALTTTFKQEEGLALTLASFTLDAQFATLTCKPGAVAVRLSGMAERIL